VRIEMTVVSSKIMTLIRISIWILLLTVTIITVLYWIYVRVPDPEGYYQHDPLHVGIETTVPTPKTQLILRQQVQAEARISAQEELDSIAGTNKQILFGDTHVHTTWSLDAFMFSLPIMNGSRGAYPPAAACDYARYISQLDFFFLADHAESYTPKQWSDAQEAVRRCNALSGDANNPDMVAFMGFEWSQIGNTSDDHYGHHNVLFRDIEKELLPARPIGASGLATKGLRESSGKKGIAKMLKWLDMGNSSYYQALITFLDELRQIPDCAQGIPSPELPVNCYETAATPGELYDKLDQWGVDSLVVPHGSSWGIYTPPGSSWDHQLTKENHDPKRGRLIEVYSGHGNSENYRNFQPRAFNADGKVYCPEPQSNYLPSCWQAGVIIKQRCEKSGSSVSDCNTRAEQARQHYVEIEGVSGWLSVPGSTVDDWLDAGQARDVFLPAFNYAPKKSVQYGLALRNFDDLNNPLRYKWGLIGSTDSHFARPGHGYKQFPRIGTGDAGMRGGRTPFWDWLIYERNKEKPAARSRSLLTPEGETSMSASEQERKMSFLTAGGVVAVHAQGRDRAAIWNSLVKREVYGTSGHRILLWFDLINAGDHPQPMGSEVTMSKAPHFKVTAIGSFKQKPGCPKYVEQALQKKRLEHLAGGECYNPSDERYLIDRIEVVRIRPQNYANEAIEGLVEDIWQAFDCAPSPSGCTVEFSDMEFIEADRDAVYYVRAIEELSPMINGGNLRAKRNSDGNVVQINPCYGDNRTDRNDNCHTLKGQRAWSSPIFVNTSHLEGSP
jgi:hypothetical protein